MLVDVYTVHLVELLHQFHVIGLHELQLHLQFHHRLREVGRQDELLLVVAPVVLLLGIGLVLGLLALLEDGAEHLINIVPSPVSKLVYQRGYHCCEQHDDNHVQSALDADIPSGHLLGLLVSCLDLTIDIVALH